MVFGKKKPDIFDQQQDKVLKALVSNQSVLIKNNEYFIKDGKGQWQWIKKLESDNKILLKRVASLESTIKGMQETDKQFKQALSGLASLTTPTEPVEEEKQNG